MIKLKPGLLTVYTQTMTWIRLEFFITKKQKDKITARYTHGDNLNTLARTIEDVQAFNDDKVLTDIFVKGRVK